MLDNGYVRSIVVRFYEGPDISKDNQETERRKRQTDDESYVTVIVQHQFVAESNLTRNQFKTYYDDMFDRTKGQFSSSFEINPTFRGKHKINVGGM